jgi:hypothetical protein
MYHRLSIYCIFFIFQFLGITNINAINQESTLRNNLFTNYNSNIRPVNDPQQPLNVSLGLAVQNLEEFNQMEETISLNIWLRSNWNDEFLNWNSTQYNISVLPIETELWHHDIELLNAAGKPDLYLLNGGKNLYNNGYVFWSKPAIFKLSCSMNLREFPFDEQTCSMKFGSWLYSNRYLHLLPYENLDTRIDILDSFSHSEWEFINADLNEDTEDRLCCPGEKFDVLEYNFRFKRFSHYYKLSMSMTISLVVASFIIMLMEPDNVSRTSTAVFIPLTILALQLTIADKIPVVGYYTLMDNFFICCFVSSMLVSIESGIIFSLLKSKSKRLNNFLSHFYDVDKLKENYNNRHTNSNSNLNSNEVTDEDIENNNEGNEEFENTVNVLETTFDENVTTRRRTIRLGTNLNADSNTDSNTDSNSNSNSDSNIKVRSNSSINTNISDHNSIVSQNSGNSNYSNYSVISKDVVRTIEYNDKILCLSLEEKLVFDELSKIIRNLDNMFRVLLPLVFFIYIGYIYSHE